MIARPQVLSLTPMSENRMGLMKPSEDSGSRHCRKESGKGLQGSERQLPTFMPVRADKETAAASVSG